MAPATYGAAGWRTVSPSAHAGRKGGGLGWRNLLRAPSCRQPVRQSIQIVFSFTNERSPARANSRPTPDWRIPPNGNAG